MDEDLPSNIEAFLAQAAALFKRASSLSLEVPAEQDGADMSPEFWTRYLSLEQATRSLSSRIPAIAGVSSSDADTRIVTVHTMVHTTLLHLYHPSQPLHCSGYSLKLGIQTFYGF